MTLENCKRLYEHFVKIGDNKGAAEMAERIERKGGNIEQPVEEAKSKKKK